MKITVVSVLTSKVEYIWDKSLTMEDQVFWLVDAKTRPTRFIESECCGWLDTYGHPELVFSLTAIVTGHHLYYRTVM